MKTFLMSIALFVLFLSTIYVLFTFMILEFGINDALTLIDHRGLFNYALIVSMIANLFLIVNVVNKIK